MKRLRCILPAACAAVFCLFLPMTACAGRNGVSPSRDGRTPMDSCRNSAEIPAAPGLPPEAVPHSHFQNGRQKNDRKYGKTPTAPHALPSLQRPSAPILRKALRIKCRSGKSLLKRDILTPGGTIRRNQNEESCSGRPDCSSRSNGNSSDENPPESRPFPGDGNTLPEKPLRPMPRFRTQPGNSSDNP